MDDFGGTPISGKVQMIRISSNKKVDATKGGNFELGTDMAPDNLASLLSRYLSIFFRWMCLRMNDMNGSPQFLPTNDDQLDKSWEIVEKMPWGLVWPRGIWG